MGKIFISRTYNSDISDLYKSLGYHEIVGIDGKVGQSISSSVLEKLSECDIFIGIVDEISKNEIIFFEAGLAFGRNIPIIILYEGARPPSFSNLNGYVALMRHDVETLEVAVNKLIKRREGARSFVRESAAIYDNMTITEESIFSADALGPIRNESDIERQLLRLLTVSGGTDVVRGPISVGSKSWSPDVVAWIDSIEDAIGNPILFETKKKVGLKDAVKLVERAVKNLEKQTARNIIIVYQEGIDPLVLNNEYLGSSVRFITLDALREGTEKQGLGRTIMNIVMRGTT